MDKAKNSLVSAIIVLSIVCVVLVGYAANVNSQLNAERLKIVKLNVRIADLESQLSATNSKLNDQTNIINDLQASLEATRLEAIKLKAEIDTLKTTNVNLESGTSEASNAPQAALSAPVTQ